MFLQDSSAFQMSPFSSSALKVFTEFVPTFSPLSPLLSVQTGVWTEAPIKAFSSLTPCFSCGATSVYHQTICHLLFKPLLDLRRGKNAGAAQNMEQLLLGITRSRVGQHCLHSSRQGRAWQVSLHPGVPRQCIESRAGQKKHTAFGTCVDPSVCIDPSYLSFVVLDEKESLALSLKAYLRKWME